MTEPTLVERLRFGDGSSWGVGSQTTTEAADEIERLTVEIERLREALEPFASVADLIEAETEGFDDSDEIELIYHDHLFDRLTVHQFKDAREALAENR